MFKITRVLRMKDDNNDEDNDADGDDARKPERHNQQTFGLIPFVKLQNDS